MTDEEQAHYSCHDHEISPDEKKRAGVLRRLQIASLLCFSFLLVEVVGGYLAGSLAVLSDAAHLLADLASFAVAIAAHHIASMPSTATHTYGLKRIESLAALFSMASLAGVSVGLALAAINRLEHAILQSDDNFELAPNEEPIPVDGKLMSLIAGIGVVVNIILACVLGEHHVHLPGMDHSHSHSHDHTGHSEHSETNNGENCHNDSHKDSISSHDHDHGHEHSHNHEAAACHTHVGEGRPLLTGTHEHSHYGELHTDEVPSPVEESRNINLEAAFLHVLGDLLQSVAVLIAGLVIWVNPSWHLVDPICTLFFCMLVFYSTLGVIRTSVRVLLEGVPPGVSWEAVNDAIASVPGVCNVHDLHIWSISHGVSAMSAHVSTDNSDPNSIIRNVDRVCQGFGIYHNTIQVQTEKTISNCITCGEGTNRSKHCK